MPSTGRRRQTQHTLSREELDSIHWLGALNEADRARAESALTAREYGPGEYVCRVGQGSMHWFGTVEGLLKLGSEGLEGAVLTFSGMPSGAWFGEGTLLKREVFRYNVSALRHSLVAALPAETFYWLLENSVAFTRVLMTQFNERLGQFMAAKETDLLHDSDMRIARSLLALFNPVLFPRTGSAFSITQQELAYLVGTSRQRVNEALGKLVKRGVVQVEYGGVRVIDMAALRLAAVEDPLRVVENPELRRGQLLAIK